MNHTYIINKAEDYIEQHLSQSISLHDLATYVGFSDFHFHRIFKTYTSETIQQFIARIKIERSAIYLKVNQKVTITQIAQDYGYADASSYSKAFKKHFGLTPSKFRDRKI